MAQAKGSVKVLHGLQELKIGLCDTRNQFPIRDLGKIRESMAKKQKQAEVESEVELESEGSGGDGWRARGFQDLSFALLGLQEREDEQNVLLREQCRFQEQIACCLERMEARMGRSELDSTLRE